MQYDAIIVGGSFAGLAAGLQLARARRRVLIVDAGLRRNRFAETAHGFLTRDGENPDEIIAAARADLLAYPSVTLVESTVTEAGGVKDDFTVQLARGQTEKARRLILATGVVDLLPGIPGIKERWGATVLHCPYCHGYELGGGNLGVLATSEFAGHQARIVSDWGDVTVFTDACDDVEVALRQQIEGSRIQIENGAITGLEGPGSSPVGVRLADGRLIALKALFIAAATQPASPLAERLGCAFELLPHGQIVATDAWKETSVAGVYATGDVARTTNSIALAVADGVMAGVGTHQSLIATH